MVPNTRPPPSDPPPLKPPVLLPNAAAAPPQTQTPPGTYSIYYRVKGYSDTPPSPSRRICTYYRVRTEQTAHTTHPHPRSRKDRADGSHNTPPPTEYSTTLTDVRGFRRRPARSGAGGNNNNRNDRCSYVPMHDTGPAEIGQ